MAWTQMLNKFKNFRSWEPDALESPTPAGTWANKPQGFIFNNLSSK